MARKILIVEDETDIAELVQLHLEDIGAEIRICNDGLTALTILEAHVVDLLVLDLTLPSLDGLEICRRLRKTNKYIPILMLTARDSQADRILGLEIGADDYLVKPFNVMELVARVRALLRRVDALSENKSDRTIITSGSLSIDIEKRLTYIDGKEITLTEKEFELLVHFSSSPGRVFSRDQLLHTLWGASFNGYEHTVNSHISRLRSKIESDPANPYYIQTVWGIGYKFGSHTNNP